jgi:UDP-N-acetylmuramoylalanine--D-glutamate ligase
MGGNIGLPILGRDPLPEGGVYVLELSSYQIDLTSTLDCDVVALTNITPDHLDRYEDMAAYERAKARLFWMQSESHWHVYDRDEPGVLSLDDLIDNEHLRSSEWLVEVDKLFLKTFLPESLAGPHNLNNASLALNSVAAALAYGYDLNATFEILDRLAPSLKSYSGLPHRMEPVGELNGVRFVNDSKATNPDSAAPALAAYPAIHWILGGQAKTNELDACAPYYTHVRAAYTIGDAGPMFAKLLTPHMPVAECVTLDIAVNKAAAAAQPGETVLLSPACASFDQFTDYEARGAAFRAAVEALP